VSPHWTWLKTGLARSGSGGGQQAVAVGDGGGFGAGGDAEFGQNVRHVDAGGLGTDEQCAGDLAVGVAFSHEGEDFAFPVGQSKP
jgi:hypothetical protein